MTQITNKIIQQKCDSNNNSDSNKKKCLSNKNDLINKNVI